MELRKTLSAPMLAQVMASGMQICFAGFQVTMVRIYYNKTLCKKMWRLWFFGNKT